MTFFIDGLRPEIIKLVARFRKNQYRQDLTFESFIYFSKDVGDSFHPMEPPLGTPRPSAGNPKPLAGLLQIPRAISRSLPPNQQVAFLH